MVSDLLFELLQLSLGTRERLSRASSADEWERLYELAEEQAITGLLLKGLERLPEAQLPPLELKLQWIGEVQIIQHENKMMDKAVVNLCQKMEKAGIRIFVFKGQTLAVLYPDATLRQSGDIDFYCHLEDWEKGLQWFKEEWQVEPDDTNASKDVEFMYQDIAYEMHNKLTLFMNPKHGRYWEEVVMPEIKANLCSVTIDNYEVSTLSPLYNVLYVFVHIFQHLISDGIGLRQFVDWYYLMEDVRWKKDNVDLLERHLDGIGMRSAFIGLGTVLTDYMGLPKEKFPFPISEKDHGNASALVANIIEYGNFGQNIQYTQQRGVIHAMQHIGRVVGQSRRFGHYAPAEVWWRIPHMFVWWGKKVWRIVKKF